MELKGVIFDLDGVIVDTVPMHYSAWKRLFSEVGIKFDFTIYKKYVDGIPRIEGLKNMMPEADEKRMKDLAERKQGYYLKELDKNPPEIFEDARYLIKELKSHRIKMAIASSSKNCRHILKKTGLKNMDVIVDGNDFKKGKPDPEIFLKTADRMGLRPEECLVIEDAILGVKAAKAAGMRCIYIMRKEDKKRSKESDWVLNNLSISYEELVSKGDRAGADNEKKNSRTH